MLKASVHKIKGKTEMQSLSSFVKTKNKAKKPDSPETTVQQLITAHSHIVRQTPAVTVDNYDGCNGGSQTTKYIERQSQC